MEIIKATPNANGKIIIEVMKRKFDVTGMIGEDGKGTVKLFGKEYEVQVKKTKKKAKTEEVAESPEAENKEEAIEESEA